MIRFLGFIVSIAMLKLSIKLSNPLIETRLHCTKLLSKVCVKQCFEILVYVLWRVSHLLNFLTLFLSIGMSFWLWVKWHLSNLQVTCKSHWKTLEYDAHKCEVKIELYHIFKATCNKLIFLYLKARQCKYYTLNTTYIQLNKLSLIRNSMISTKIWSPRT